MTDRKMESLRASLAASAAGLEEQGAERLAAFLDETAQLDDAELRVEWEALRVLALNIAAAEAGAARGHPGAKWN